MNDVTVTTHENADLLEILSPEEVLLWSGTPDYGKKYYQVVGQERLYHACIIVGIVVLWGAVGWIEPDKKNDAINFFAVMTVLLIIASLITAFIRQFVLSKMVYLVTDRRAILVRGGRDWRSRSRLYVISCAHSLSYPYKIIPDKPYASLQVGNLLTDEPIQPFGLGIAHPGLPFLWGRLYPPVFFNYIDNAQEIEDLIKSHAAKLLDEDDLDE